MPTMMDNTAHASAQATVYNRLDSRFFCYAGASTTDPSESFSSMKRLAEGSAGTAEGHRSLRRSAKSTNSPRSTFSITLGHIMCNTQGTGVGMWWRCMYRHARVKPA